MTNELAATLTDVLLAWATFVMGLTVGKRKSLYTWSAFFLMLGLAAGLGAIFHGTSKFHTPEFWVLVSCTSTASSFLFLAACLCVYRPEWFFLSWLWPAFGLAGILLGGILAPMPFWYISVVTGIITFFSTVLIKSSPSKESRNLIYAGIIATMLGLVAQKITNFDGICSHNSLFHLLQLAGNFLFWLGAKRI